MTAGGSGCRIEGELERTRDHRYRLVVAVGCVCYGGAVCQLSFRWSRGNTTVHDQRDGRCARAHDIQPHTKNNVPAAGGSCRESHSLTVVGAERRLLNCSTQAPLQLHLWPTCWYQRGRVSQLGKSPSHPPHIFLHKQCLLCLICGVAWHLTANKSSNNENKSSLPRHRGRAAATQTDRPVKHTSDTHSNACSYPTKKCVVSQAKAPYMHTYVVCQN